MHGLFRLERSIFVEYFWIHEFMCVCESSLFRKLCDLIYFDMSICVSYANVRIESMLRSLLDSIQGIVVF